MQEALPIIDDCSYGADIPIVQGYFSTARENRRDSICMVKADHLLLRNEKEYKR